MGQRVRDVIFPIVRQCAVRVAWTDVVAEIHPDPHRLAQRLRTRAMAEVTTLLDRVVRHRLTFFRIADASGLRASQREFLVVEALVKAFPEKIAQRRWRRRMETMLSCTPQALWARRARQKKRQDSHQG
jgi:hypothetical protein